MSADEKIAYLQKREAKLTRELAVERKRGDKLEDFVQKLASAIKTGLPHMQLIDLTWLDNEENPHG